MFNYVTKHHTPHRTPFGRYKRFLYVSIIVNGIPFSIDWCKKKKKWIPRNGDAIHESKPKVEKFWNFSIATHRLGYLHITHAACTLHMLISDFTPIRTENENFCISIPHVNYLPRRQHFENQCKCNDFHISNVMCFT